MLLKMKCLSRDTIKLIALFTMTLNHISLSLMQQSGVIALVFKYIGYFTAIVMVFFLVQGYSYTKSKCNYAKRLLVFGVISQVPFSFALLGFVSIVPLNMFFALAICLCIVDVYSGKSSAINKVIIIGALVFLSLFCDWPLMAPVFTLLFVWAQKSTIKRAMAFAIATVGFFAFTYNNEIALSFLEENALTPVLPLQSALYSMLGIISAGVVIVLFYNEGHDEKMQSAENEHTAEKLKKLKKYFYYAYYPAHLTVLCVLKFLG